MGIFSNYKHYSIQILKNRKIYLRVEGGNKSFSDPKGWGTYYTKLSRKQFRYFKKFARYIRLNNLHQLYDINRADVSYCTIKMQVKEFEYKKTLDRGLQGTFGRRALYSYLDILYKTLPCKKGNTPVKWDVIWSTLGIN